MILPQRIADGVAAGRVSLAYRRWSQPRVRAGSTFMTSAGVVEITGIERVDPEAIIDADARRAGAESADAVRKSLHRSPDNPVFRIGLAWAGPDPRHELSATDTLSDQDVAEIAARLDRLDRSSTHGPWTYETLRLIESRPGQLAADLATSVGREKAPFKVDVRKLKNLGLTHSLEIGYQLSPRGAAFLGAHEDD